MVDENSPAVKHGGSLSIRLDVVDHHEFRVVNVTVVNRKIGMFRLQQPGCLEITGRGIELSQGFIGPAPSEQGTSVLFPVLLLLPLLWRRCRRRLLLLFLSLSSSLCSSSGGVLCRLLQARCKIVPACWFRLIGRIVARWVRGDIVLCSMY